MQVILLERVAKLGQMGEVVNVRPGYARNFLIPTGKALRATDDALQRFEKRRAELEAANDERRDHALAMAGQVDGQSVVILRQASESDQLYGSVSARDVAEAFAAEGVEIERRQVRMEHPIKTTGIHDVTVALHPEVEVAVQVNVARSKEEADIQAGLAPAEEPEREEEVHDDDQPDPRLALFDALED